MIERYKQDKEFYKVARKIIYNKEYKKLRTFLHHNSSVYDHCLDVSYNSYLVAKKLKKVYRNINIENVIIAGLLHDFYREPWRDNKKKGLFNKHGFTHAAIALERSKETFSSLLNKRIENAIVRHMFPLNIRPPKYIEGWIITLVDKYVSLDMFKSKSTILRCIGCEKIYNRGVQFADKCYIMSTKLVMNMY